MSSDISVIICTYTEKRWHDLVAAVASVQQQSIPSREIIVVVDHNPPLLQQIQNHLPSIVAVENQEPRGLSGARNSGIAVAQGTLIAFLDDDAIAQRDWLARLSACCADVRVLGAGGRVDPLWEGKRPAWLPEEFYWVIGCSYQEPTQTAVIVRNPYGGCNCMRREIFETVGGFRNGIGRLGMRPLGGEETELCIRARQYWPHRHFLYEPLAQIQHRVPSSRVNWRYFQARCYAEGLSKAMIARYVGTADGLASERVYTLRTLPKGVLHGIMDGLLRRDHAGFLRAGAIIAGLLITVAGYVVGRLSRLEVSHEGVHDSVQKKYRQSSYTR